MRKSTLGKLEAAPRLGMMIHEAVREAIERAVDEELEAALGAKPYARTEERRGYRNGFAHAGAHGPDGQVRDERATRDDVHEERQRGVGAIEGAAAVLATDRRGRRGSDGRIPERSEYATNPAVRSRRSSAMRRSARAPCRA